MNIFENLENLNVSEECFDDIIGIVEEILSEALPDAVEKRYPREKTQLEFNKEVDTNGIKNWDKVQELGRRLGLHRKAEDWATQASLKKLEHGKSARDKQDEQLRNNQIINHDDGEIEFISNPKDGKKLIKKAIDRNKRKNK